MDRGRHRPRLRHDRMTRRGGGTTPQRRARGAWPPTSCGSLTGGGAHQHRAAAADRALAAHRRRAPAPGRAGPRRSRRGGRRRLARAQTPGSARVHGPPARAGPSLVGRRPAVPGRHASPALGPPPRCSFAVPGLDPRPREIEGDEPRLACSSLRPRDRLEPGYEALFRCLEIDARPRRARTRWTSLGAGRTAPAGGIGGLAIGAWALSLYRRGDRVVVRRCAMRCFC